MDPDFILLLTANSQEQIVFLQYRKEILYHVFSFYLVLFVVIKYDAPSIKALLPRMHAVINIISPFVIHTH